MNVLKVTPRTVYTLPTGERERWCCRRIRISCLNSLAHSFVKRALSMLIPGILLALAAEAGAQGWLGYGSNPQHTALSPTSAQSLQAIRWQTPVDLNPQYNGSD